MLFLLAAGLGYGQQIIPGKVKDFSVPLEYYEPPHERQMKALLQGAEAQPLTNGQVLVTQARLQSYRTNGAPELRVEAPEAIYDQAGGAAFSSGPLRVQTADGKFSIEGEGFLWQTNSSLFISNRVHTVVHPELLEGPAVGAAAGSPAQRSRAKGAGASGGAGLDIFSDQFQYAANAGLGIYRRNVQVSGTNLALSSRKLTVKVPMSASGRPAGLQTITAEQDVVMEYLLPDYGKVHATGKRAIYSAATGLVRVSGPPAPSWRADGRQGRGDELVMDRTNKIFRANGRAWLKMPGESLGLSSFLPRENAPAAKPPQTTNRWVEITCDHYEFHTNWASFEDGVRAKEYRDGQPQSTMSCNRMIVTFAGNNELQTLVAEKGVVIEQQDPLQHQDKRLAGARAVYTATNGLLELTGRPTWQVGRSEGKGKQVLVNSRRNEMVVRGNASIRMPAEELGQAALGPGRSVSRIGTNQFAKVFCEEYTLRPEKSARFKGGVYASHPQMNWACETLTVQSAPGGGKVILADQSVVFDLVDEKGQKVHGMGAKAVYTNSVTGAITNDVVRLSGVPATLIKLEMKNGLEATNVIVQNDMIVLDRTHNQLSTAGPHYRIFSPPGGAETNMFTMPKIRPGK